MYDWLDSRLGDDTHIVTASRRLSRVLRAEHAAKQLAAGRQAWNTPQIFAWHDWLSRLLVNCVDQGTVPILITEQQSRVLWERCLRREIHDPLLNIGALARQSKDTWRRLQEWRITAERCRQRARNADQRIFASAAISYQSLLSRDNWIDDAGITDCVADRLRRGEIALPAQLVLAGFDRVVPQLQNFLQVVADAGSRYELVTIRLEKPQLTLSVAENSDAELRAAGHWAGKEIRSAPQSRIAIVVTQLEQDAARSLRLIKEGMLPGWQNASAEENAVVNLSYGRKLADFAAVAAALLVLRWLHADLPLHDVSRVLRSALFGTAGDDGRSRVELRLRRLPDRLWSPAALHDEIVAWGDKAGIGDSSQWLQKLQRRRASLPQRQSPAAWAAFFSEVLQDLGWPGSTVLDSAEFQLVNRWRELLNELARLELVSPSMRLETALGRLSGIAAEVVYQPENSDAIVQVLGPLEAAGMQFDRLWITGLSAANWPPSSRSLALVSRELQREVGMPDATPADTLQYAERVLARLIGSAAVTVCSYAETHNDAIQSVSRLLYEHPVPAALALPDPGWAARRLTTTMALDEAPDPVPAITAEETLAGGAATLQRHVEEPLAAFAIGRLGINPLPPIVSGLPANIRGSLLHKALHRMYIECPDSAGIQAWTASEIKRRAAQAADAAFRAIERHTDPVLRQILAIERARVIRLLEQVVELDVTREPFSIRSVEREVDTDINGLRLRLRIDRLDVSTDCPGEHLILDYKTGAAKRLLDRRRTPNDLQLIVYARALDAPVAGVAFFNVDARSVDLDGAGRVLTPELEWDRWLETWCGQVDTIAAEIAAGDVRISGTDTERTARTMGLLGRHRELLRDL